MFYKLLTNTISTFIYLVLEKAKRRMERKMEKRKETKKK